MRRIRASRFGRPRRPGLAFPAPLLSALLTLPLAAAPASALVVDGTRPSLVERAPQDDPGWRNVGKRAGRTAVYIGNGWMLTAAHVGAGPVELDGVSFPNVPGSELTLDAPGRLGRRADVLLFRVDPVPALPPLPIRKRRVPAGHPLLLVGYGNGRGKRIVWEGIDGFEWEKGAAKRWGTNLAESSRTDLPGPGNTLTVCFSASFDEGETPHEAQGATGDSGGAVFARGPKRWTLAGLMVAIEAHSRQPPKVSLFGNRTQFADLSVYRNQILRVTGLGEPGPPPGGPTRAEPAPLGSARDEQPHQAEPAEGGADSGGR